MYRSNVSLILYYLVTLLIKSTKSNTLNITASTCPTELGADTSSWIGVSLIGSDGSHSDIVEFNADGNYWDGDQTQSLTFESTITCSFSLSIKVGTNHN